MRLSVVHILAATLATVDAFQLAAVPHGTQGTAELSSRSKGVKMQAQTVTVEVYRRVAAPAILSKFTLGLLDTLSYDFVEKQTINVEPTDTIVNIKEKVGKGPGDLFLVKKKLFGDPEETLLKEGTLSENNVKNRALLHLKLYRARTPYNF